MHFGNAVAFVRMYTEPAPWLSALVAAATKASPAWAAVRRCGAPSVPASAPGDTSGCCVRANSPAVSPGMRFDGM